MPRMTNDELEEELKAIHFLRAIKNATDGEAGRRAERVREEFDRRGVTEYKGRQIDAVLSPSPSSHYDVESVLEDYTPQELIEIGALAVQKKPFEDGTGLAPEERKKYLVTEDGAPRLLTRPKPPVPKADKDYVSKLIRSYPAIPE